MTNSPARRQHDIPILLLPPSEGKAAGGAARTRWSAGAGSFGSLGDHRRRVAEALAAAGGGDSRLLGVGGDHLDRARHANVALVGGRTLPAWERYTGVVWEHLDPETLTAGQRRRIVVVSGLLGLLRGDDPVPDYRLKMSANLPPLGKLSTWWRADLSAALNRRLRPDVVVDLLPKEHRAAWTPDDRVDGVSVEFVDPTGRPGGHFAKAAKGRLARSLLVDGLDALDGWADDRFQLAVTPL